jgi:hypothetical protein
MCCRHVLSPQLVAMMPPNGSLTLAFKPREHLPFSPVPAMPQPQAPLPAGPPGARRCALARREVRLRASLKHPFPPGRPGPAAPLPGLASTVRLRAERCACALRGGARRAMASSSGSGGQWGGGWAWWKSSSGWQDDDGGASEAPDWGGSQAVKDEGEAEHDEEEDDETKSQPSAEKRQRKERGGKGRPSRMRWLAHAAGTKPPQRLGGPGEGHLRYDDRGDAWKKRYLVEKAMHTQMADITKLQDMLFKAESLDGWKWCRRLTVSPALILKLLAPCV